MKRERPRFCLRELPLLVVLITFLLIGRALSSWFEEPWKPIGPDGGWIIKLMQHSADENTLYAMSGQYPHAIYKSTDMGSIWVYVNGINDYIYDCTLDPWNGNRIYALGYSRLYRSDDAGLSWNYFWAEDTRFMAIKPDPKTQGLVHLAGSIWKNGRYDGHYYLSTNYGETWSSVKITENYFYIRCLALDPTNPARIFVWGSDTDGRPKLFRSQNEGINWSDITTDDITGPIQDIEIDPSSGKVVVCTHSNILYSINHGDTWIKPSDWCRGYNLAIDPNNSNIVYAGDYNRVFRSDDGGTTWNRYDNVFYGNICEHIIVDWSNTSTLFLSTRAGVFRSTDRGEHWETRHSGLRASNITTIGIHPSSPSTLFLASEYDALYKTTNALAKTAGSSDVDWERLEAPYSCHNAVAIRFDPANPDMIFVFEGGG